MLGWFKKKLGKLSGKGVEPEEDKVEAELEEIEVLETSSEVEAIPVAELEEPVAEAEEDKVEAELEEIEVLEAPSEVEAIPVAELEESVTEAEEEKVDAAVIPIPEESDKSKSIPHEDVGGFFSRLTKRLSKSRGSLVKRVDELFLGKKVIDQELLDDLEEILITADLGISTTQELVDHASDKVARKELSDPSALKKVLREKITEYLLSSDQPAELVMPESGPFIIMVVGVNGVGKTTTIGKMARKFVRSGQSVALVAADTFRAAAIEQLQIWGKRIGVEVISQEFGADPSSVVFDALATARNFDVVIIDTAGRLHTKVNLMEELKKIKRVAGKKLEGAPHEVMLVLDATTGQNGISQARLFNEAVGVTGLALTKLDGTAKGGIVVNVCREFNIPIRFIGIGEQMDDLRDFDPNEFAEALFAEDNDESGES
ncbi:MAG: signal recognition particle-docking protein FtsY [Thermodesulfobacteriota bacterium]|nr:signal recognition particle-docking protein FtsY [Thermodesulfobacteriota bacterium]